MLSTWIETLNDQTTSANVASMRRKMNNPDSSNTRAAATETSIVAPGGSVPSSAHLNPEISPTNGFTAYNARNGPSGTTSVEYATGDASSSTCIANGITY